MKHNHCTRAILFFFWLLILRIIFVSTIFVCGCERDDFIQRPSKNTSSIKKVQDCRKVKVLYGPVGKLVRVPSNKLGDE